MAMYCLPLPIPCSERFETGHFDGESDRTRAFDGFSSEFLPLSINL